MGYILKLSIYIYSKAVDVVTDIIASDWQNIKEKTKLSILDLQELIELCLAKCYFVWNREICVIDDAGAIGLSLMVVMAEGYLQYIEQQALKESISLYQIQPNTCKR